MHQQYFSNVVTTANCEHYSVVWTPHLKFETEQIKPVQQHFPKGYVV